MSVANATICINCHGNLKIPLTYSQKTSANNLEPFGCRMLCVWHENMDENRVRFVYTYKWWDELIVVITLIKGINSTTIKITR